MYAVSLNPGVSARQKECSFLKKRTKKLLRFETGVAPRRTLKEQKFFASFFQKRRPFFLPFSISTAARPMPITGQFAGSGTSYV